MPRLVTAAAVREELTGWREGGREIAVITRCNLSHNKMPLLERAPGSRHYVSISWETSSLHTQGGVATHMRARDSSFPARPPSRRRAPDTMHPSPSPPPRFSSVPVHARLERIWGSKGMHAFSLRENTLARVWFACWQIKRSSQTRDTSQIR